MSEKPKPKMVKVRNTAEHPAQRIQPGAIGEVPEDLAALCDFFEIVDEPEEPKGGKPGDDGKGETKSRALERAVRAGEIASSGDGEGGKTRGGKPRG